MILPDRSTHAASFARRLHALSLNRSSGLVTLRSPARRFQLVLVEGSVMAGIGSADADGGIAGRLAEVLRWPALWCSFEPCARTHPHPHAYEPAGPLLLQAAELAVGADDLDAAALRVPLELSRFGRSLIDSGVALTPDTWHDGLRGSQLLAAGMARARLRAALFLQAIVPSAARSLRSYPLLLRKHRELSRSADAYQLLELAPDADAASAGKALRRLAARLHPDVLGPDAPPELRALSSELICALTRAEHTLRGSRPRG